MSHKLKLTAIGNSLGVILPKTELEVLGVSEGDKLFVVRTSQGIRLTPYDPDFAKAVDTARDYMREHRDALLELAK